MRDDTTARFEAAVHSPTLDALEAFPAIVEAIVWISETVDSAPAGEYVLGTVRDPRGVLVAACDNRGRTWTPAEGPAATIAGWRTA